MQFNAAEYPDIHAVHWNFQIANTIPGEANVITALSLSKPSLCEMESVF